MIGVTVLIKGTSVGAVTDFDGSFTLEAPADAEILTFSYTGIPLKRWRSADQTTFNIILQESTTTLDEVVVVGYGTQKKRDLTGAVVSVQSERFC